MYKISKSQDLQLKRLATLVEEKAKLVNITSIRDFEGIWEKHILDSLEFLNTEFFKTHIGENFEFMDFGTGAGFPGLPLAVMLPNSKFSLVDGTRKKTEIVRDFVNELGLKNVQPIWTRAEDIGQKYDLVLARAVKFLPELLSSAVGNVSKGGSIVAFKVYSEQEIKAGKDICSELCLTKIEEYKYFLCGQDRVILIYKKN